MQNILLLSYHFPPEMSGGVGRAYSLYKYLPRYGYKPIVITNSCYGLLLDEENIHRFDALANWPNSNSIMKKFLLKAVRNIIRLYGFEELRDFYWQKKVLNRITQILTENEVPLVYSTYPSIDNLRLGLRLNQREGLPLITEFRDGLTYEPVKKLSLFNRSRMKTFESHVVRASSLVITIGENLSEYFSIHYPDSRIYTVNNGFDPADFKHINSAESAPIGKTRVVHFGSINASRRRDVTPLFKSLQRLRNREHVTNSAFELWLIGNYTRGERRLIKKFHLDDIVKIRSPMNKCDGFLWIANKATHLLFYGVEGEKSIISTKLLEYLNLGKPIIGICKGNEAEKIIKDTKTGEVCDFRETCIYELFKKCLTDGITYQPDQVEINKFNRIGQAKEISELITHAISNVPNR